MSDRSRLAVPLALTLLFGSMLLQAQDREGEGAFIKAQAELESALRGGRKAVTESALQQFKQLSEQEPANPLFRAYHGSAYAIKGDDALMPWTRLKLTGQGLDLIDKALEQLTPQHDEVTLRGAPMGLETRLVAITTFLAVPDKHFHRLQAGKDLLTQAMNSAVFESASPQLKARFFYQAAIVARFEAKRSEEIDRLRKVLDLDAQSPDANDARARLKELGA
jgi:hypothetical protein